MLRLRDVTSDLSRIADATEGAPTIVAASPQQAMAQQAAGLLRHRQLRKRFLPADLFREPGWDMLIAIYIADRNGHPMNVKSLVAMVDAPATTSQRWIDHLDRLGLVTRATDPLDRRRIEVSLTYAGQSALEAYLSATAPK
ncbi:hypothetical protein [uncultured Sphingomonas sp.]|uniref:hypothetical protein n=1 Tax=uncultured Sphingomonas sp. TaxID=158754 RepID=UPI0035CAA248